MGTHGRSPADSADERGTSVNPYGGNPYGNGHYSDSLPERQSQADDDAHSAAGHLDANERRVPDSLPGLPDFRDNPASHEPLEDAAGPGRPRQPIASGIGAGFGVVGFATMFNQPDMGTALSMAMFGLAFVVVFGWPM